MPKYCYQNRNNVAESLEKLFIYSPKCKVKMDDDAVTQGKVAEIPGIEE